MTQRFSYDWAADPPYDEDGFPATHKAAVNDALKDLRKQGFYAKQRHECCSSCGWSAIPRDKVNGPVLFYHKQANSAWERPDNIGGYNEPPSGMLRHTLHFSWGGPPDKDCPACHGTGGFHHAKHDPRYDPNLPVDLGSQRDIWLHGADKFETCHDCEDHTPHWTGERIKSAFEKQGLTVDWDGTIDNTIGVTPDPIKKPNPKTAGWRELKDKASDLALKAVTTPILPDFEQAGRQLGLAAFGLRECPGDDPRGPYLADCKGEGCGVCGGAGAVDKDMYDANDWRDTYREMGLPVHWWQNKRGATQEDDEEEEEDDDIKLHRFDHGPGQGNDTAHSELHQQEHTGGFKPSGPGQSAPGFGGSEQSPPDDHTMRDRIYDRAVKMMGSQPCHDCHGRAGDEECMTCHDTGIDPFPNSGRGFPQRQARNDDERNQWIDNDEGLYDWHRGSGMSRRDFIKQHRSDIDLAIDRVTSGDQPAHYLKYGPGGDEELRRYFGRVTVVGHDGQTRASAKLAQNGGGGAGGAGGSGGGDAGGGSGVSGGDGASAGGNAASGVSPGTVSGPTTCDSCGHFNASHIGPQCSGELSCRCPGFIPVGYGYHKKKKHETELNWQPQERTGFKISAEYDPHTESPRQGYVDIDKYGPVAAHWNSEDRKLGQYDEDAPASALGIHLVWDHNDDDPNWFGSGMDDHHDYLHEDQGPWGHHHDHGLPRATSEIDPRIGAYEDNSDEAADAWADQNEDLLRHWASHMDPREPRVAPSISQHCDYCNGTKVAPPKPTHSTWTILKSLLKRGAYDKELDIRYNHSLDPRGRDPMNENLEESDIEQIKYKRDHPDEYAVCPDCHGSRYVNHGMDGCGYCGGFGYRERQDVERDYPGYIERLGQVDRNNYQNLSEDREEELVPNEERVMTAWKDGRINLFKDSENHAGASCEADGWRKDWNLTEGADPEAFSRNIFNEVGKHLDSHTEKDASVKLAWGYGVPKEKGGDSDENTSKLTRCVKRKVKEGLDHKQAVKDCKKALGLAQDKEVDSSWRKVTQAPGNMSGSGCGRCGEPGHTSERCPSNKGSNMMDSGGPDRYLSYDDVQPKEAAMDQAQEWETDYDEELAATLREAGLNLYDAAAPKKKKPKPKDDDDAAVPKGLKKALEKADDLTKEDTDRNGQAAPHPPKKGQAGTSIHDLTDNVGTGEHSVPVNFITDHHGEVSPGTEPAKCRFCSEPMNDHALWNPTHQKKADTEQLGWMDSFEDNRQKQFGE